MNHKAMLDKLYKECDQTFGNEWHTAFKVLSEYLETHNLTLAQVTQIRGIYKDAKPDPNCFDLA